MLESYLRPRYQNLCVEPIARYLRGKVSANSLSLLAMLCGVLFIPVLYLQHVFLGMVLLVFTGYLDTLDGTLARLENRPNPVGAVLDIVGDRVVEASIIIGLFLMAPEQRAGYCLLMLAAILICVSSFLVVGIFTANQSQKSFHYSPGLIERFEAFMCFALLLIVPHYFAWLALLFTVLVMLTAWLHIRRFMSSASYEKT